MPILGLNQFLIPENSPINNRRFIDGFEFDGKYERSTVTNTFLQDGVITAIKIGDAQITNAKIDSVSADKITAGTVTVAMDLGDGNITLDGASKRILINDGTHDRVLIGYQSGGF